MVKETRIIIEIQDILTFKLRCNKCQSEISTDLEKMARLIKCPFCEKIWEIEGQISSLPRALLALEELRDKPPSNRTLLIEIDGKQVN